MATRSAEPVDLWLSCEFCTVGVTVQGGRVVAAAPVVRWALGKPLETLLKWMVRKGGFQMAVLGHKEIIHGKA